MNVTRYEISQDFNPLAENPLAALIDTLYQIRDVALKGRNAHVDWSTLRVEEMDTYSLFRDSSIQKHTGPMRLTVDAVALSTPEVRE